MNAVRLIDYYFKLKAIKLCGKIKLFYGFLKLDIEIIRFLILEKGFTFSPKLKIRTDMDSCGSREEAYPK